jgi:PAS domain S-box-containing protein
LLLQQTQELAGVGGWEYDVVTRELHWTETALRMLDLSEGTALSADVFAAMVVAEDRPHVEGAWQSLLRGGAPTSIECRVITARGRQIWIRSLGRGVSEDGRLTRLVGANLDVTDRKALEARLLMVDRLSAMGTVAAGVAHEINNPLSFLMGSVPLVQSRLFAAASEGSTDSATAVLARELEPMLRDCMAGVERIAAIARDLRVYTRFEDTRPIAVPVRDVLGTVVRMVQNEVERNARLRVEVGAQQVLSTPTRFAQVLTNLLVNAAQAMPERPARDNLIEVHAAEREGGLVAIEVRDNGRGIAPDLGARIFDPFFTTKGGEGTGLGLFVCQAIVTSDGGRIEVESEPGRGTTMRVLLRRADAASEASAPVAAPASARILLVDDEANLLRVLTRVLQDYDVVTVSEALAAIDLLARGEVFDLILCDLMMPDLNGVDFFARVREVAPPMHERCVFMTGGAVSEGTQAFLDGLPAGRVLEKPFTPATLLRFVISKLRR